MRAKDAGGSAGFMKVALVHDYLTRFGGAERVLLELAQMFPEAPIYTFLYDEKKMSEWFAPERVRVSFLQKFPKFLKKRPKYLLPFLPVAPETFDLRDFDLVISSSSSFAKGVITRPKTLHINYCHNPARFLWDYNFEYLKEQKLGNGRNILVKILLNYLRIWDRAAGRRVDCFIANSQSTARRIKKYYQQEVKIIYPPVKMAKDWHSVKSNGDYYLIVSQLTPYKKVDVAVEAFNKLGLPLVVIGEGPQKETLQKIAQKNIKFLGWLDDAQTEKYYQNCRAFIFAGEDDFGIAPVEAMSFGKPVLALRAGGAEETILPGITGEFFETPLPEVLADGVRRLRENEEKFSSHVIRKWAERFSQQRFRREMMEFIKKVGYN
jgi:glycosyltransferase involved in cell wall biosynthesis